jgi:hypothetical protein
MDRRYFKIRGHDELRRDAESMGIVNVDTKALNKYKEEREFRRKLSRVVDEHEGLKNDVGEMKAILAQILKELTK